MEKGSDMTSLKHHLLHLDKKDLVDLLLQQVATTHLEQYQTLAEQAFAIIHEHNEYGGGPDDEYDQVDSYLTEINELFNDHKLSSDIKRQYVDQCFKYYDWDNSGMTDMLMESIEGVSESTEDWQYVISKLQKPARSGHSSSYRQKLITDICKTRLKDNQTE